MTPQEAWNEKKPSIERFKLTGYTNPEIEKIIISRDVVFEENTTWSWFANKKNNQQIQVNDEFDEENTMAPTPPQTEEEVKVQE
ncbi:hypothetical protein EV2_033040 [Malus domestica]